MSEYQSIKLKKEVYEKLKNIKKSLNVDYTTLFNIFFTSLEKNDDVKELIEKYEEKNKYNKFRYDIEKVRNLGKTLKRCKYLYNTVKNKKYEDLDDLATYFIEFKLIMKYYKNIDLIKKYYENFLNLINNLSDEEFEYLKLLVKDLAKEIDINLEEWYYDRRNF